MNPLVPVRTINAHVMYSYQDGGFWLFPRYSLSPALEITN